MSRTLKKDKEGKVWAEQQACARQDSVLVEVYGWYSILAALGTAVSASLSWGQGTLPAITWMETLQNLLWPSICRWLKDSKLSGFTFGTI